MMRLALWLGLRYAFRGGRRGYVSFVSLVSLASLYLGVVALVVVVSVMNGFDRELKARILGVVPHLVVAGAGPAERALALAAPEVAWAAPFARTKGLLTDGWSAQLAEIYGIDPRAEPRDGALAQALPTAALARMQAEPDLIYLGRGLGYGLGLIPGDTLTLALPEVKANGQVRPRLVRLRLGGYFRLDSPLDYSLAVMPLRGLIKNLPANNHSPRRGGVRQSQAIGGGGAATAARAKGSASVAGPPTGDAAGYALASPTPPQGGSDYLLGSYDLRVVLGDLFAAQALAARWRAAGLQVSSWAAEHGDFFATVRMEKIMMFILLSFVVAIASFGMVGSLSMLVEAKQAEIAALMTMGYGVGAVMLTFMLQGMSLALIGIAAGALTGVPLALAAPGFMAALANLTGVDLIQGTWFDAVPVDIRWGDVGIIALTAALISLLATLYPAWRAAQLRPARILRGA